MKLNGNNRIYYYDNINPIAHSKNGRLYKAWSREHELFAIRELIIPQDEQLLDFNENLEKELTNFLTLNEEKSPHTVAVLELIKKEGAAYLVMEYCNDGDLKTYLMNKPDLNTDEVIYLFSQVLEGMKALEKMNLITGYVKPENILVKNGILKIKKNFQFSNFLRIEFTLEILEPAYFMAPEMITQESKDPFKAAIFSLGVLLYWLIVRRNPWEANIKKRGKAITSFSLLNEMQQQLDRENPELWYPEHIVIDEHFKNWIMSMVEFNPEKRIYWKNLISLFAGLTPKIQRNNMRLSLKSSKGKILNNPKAKSNDRSAADDTPADEFEFKEIMFDQFLSKIEMETYIYIFLYNVSVKIINQKRNINITKDNYYKLLLHLSSLAYVFSFYLEKTLESKENLFRFPKEEWQAFVHCEENIRFKNLKKKIVIDNKYNKANFEAIVETAKDENIKMHKYYKNKTPKFTQTIFQDFLNCLKETLIVLEKKLEEIEQTFINFSSDFNLLLLIEDLMMVATLKSTFNCPGIEIINLENFYKQRQSLDKNLLYSRVKNNFKEIRSQNYFN